MKDRLEHIDALRGLASLAIVVFHVIRIPSPHLEIPPYLDFAKNHFGFGVSMFFVISGFSLFLSVFKAGRREEKLAAFYLRRFFRIAPLFYFMVVFWVGVRFFVFHGKTWPKEILLNITFLYNLFPAYHESIVWAGWPISIEMIFYLTVPLVTSIVRTLRSSIILLLLSVGGAFAFQQVLIRVRPLPGNYFYMNFPTQAPLIATGIVSYYLFKQLRLSGPERWKYRTVLGITLAVLIAIIYMMDNGIIAVRSQLPSLYARGMAFGLIINMLGAWTPKILVNTVTRFTGRISYSMYLAHPFLIYSLVPLYRRIYELEYMSILSAFLLCLLITLAVLVPIAVLLYYGIESPARRWGYSRILRSWT